MPAEASNALFLDALARRYGCLPTDILAADVANLRIAATVALMTGDGDGG